MPSSLRIVLLRPRVSENVGAVARAMKNFGLSDWVLVAPEAADESAARRLAVQAEDVLAARRHVATFAEATEGCAWIVGTTSRTLPGVRRLDAAQFAREAVARDAPVALVFGDERIGLTNEELERCHALTAIGTDAAQPSINLAQAVLLYAYEWSRARRQTDAPPLPIAATDAELESLGGVLRDLLTNGGFLNGPERHAIRDLLRPLQRARLTRDEFRLWNAALRSLGKRLSRD